MFKKFIAFFICFNIIILPGYCTINDNFAEQTLPKSKIIQTFQAPNIDDNFVKKTLDKNSRIKTLQYKIIEDTFAEENTRKNQYSRPKVDFQEQIIIPTKTVKKTRRPIIIVDENSTPVKIRIKQYLSTKEKPEEGDYIEFETLKEIKINNKTYQAGATVKARIETVSLNNIWGVPSDLIVGNFSIDGNRLNGEISKTGANRSLWLYPSVYATLFFFGAGLLLIPIRGGHAKIKPNQIYTVHYYN